MNAVYTKTILMKSIQSAKLLQDTIELYNSENSFDVVHIKGGSSHFNYTFETGDDLIKLKYSDNMHGVKVGKSCYLKYFGDKIITVVYLALNFWFLV